MNKQEKNTPPSLRDLARKIEDVCREHPCYSQAWEIVSNCSDHLRAVAFVNETNQRG